MMVLLWALVMVVFIGAVLGGVAWLLKRAEPDMPEEVYEGLRYTVYHSPLGEDSYKEYAEYDTIEQVREAVAALEDQGFDCIIWDDQMEDWHRDT